MSDDDITIDDLNKIVPFFRWGLVLLGLIIVITIAVAGYKGWPWYIAIPIGMPLFFGTKVLKNMVLNADKTMRAEILEQDLATEGLEIGATDFDTYSQLSEGDKARLNKITEHKIEQNKTGLKLPLKSLPIIIVLMGLVGWFWYGLGWLLSLIVS